MLVKRCPNQGKNKRVACLQAGCADNQQFFKTSELAEFFAASSLVFTIFFRNFKIAGCESYEAKRHITLYMVYLGGPKTRE